MTEEEARNQPLAARFYLASYFNDESREDVVGIDGFLALMKHEYKIIVERVRALRKINIENRHHKNIDRIDGITQVLTMLEARQAEIELIYNALGSPKHDPLQSAKVKAVHLFECSCGDFTGTEVNVDSHVRMMHVMEETGTHTKLIPVKSDQDSNDDFMRSIDGE